MFSPILTWRDTFLKTLPSWLLGKNGYRLATVLGLQWDLLGTALDWGIRSRYPGVNSEVTSLIGRQRGIPRGPNEDEATYVRRLQYWRQIRRRGGNWYALLEQLQLFFYPEPVYTRAFSDNGTRYTLAPGGWQYTITGYDPNTAPSGTVVTDSVTWDWDGTTDKTRAWVMIYCPTLWPSAAAYASDLTFADSGTVDDGGTVGSTALPRDISGLLETVRTMTPPHAKMQQVILAFSSGDFDAVAPDGTWGDPWNRNPNYEYVNV